MQMQNALPIGHKSMTLAEASHALHNNNSLIAMQN
jgi:hypothetical protein